MYLAIVSRALVVRMNAATLPFVRKQPFLKEEKPGCRPWHESLINSHVRQPFFCFRQGQAKASRVVTDVRESATFGQPGQIGMPSHLVQAFLSEAQVGMAGILELATTARCSVTAAAIRASECSAYPMAIIVSHGEEVAYAFLSETFKNFGKLAFLRKDRRCRYLRPDAST